MKQTANIRLSPWVIDATGLAVCLLASAVAYGLVIGPLVGQEAAIAAQREKLQEQKAMCVELETAASDLESRLTTVQKQLRQGQTLESPSLTNERVAKLATLLGDHGMAVDDVLIGDILPSAQCTLVPISIVGRSNYHEVLTSLHELTRTFADISVAKFECVGDPTGTSQSQRVKLELLWYAAPERQGVVH